MLLWFQIHPWILLSQRLQWDRSRDHLYCCESSISAIKYTADAVQFFQITPPRWETRSSPKTRNTATPSIDRHGKAQSCPAQSVTRPELGLPTEALTLLSAQGHRPFDDKPFFGRSVLCNWITLSWPVRSSPSCAGQGTSSRRSEPPLRPAAQTSLLCALQEWGVNVLSAGKMCLRSSWFGQAYFTPLPLLVGMFCCSQGNTWFVLATWAILLIQVWGGPS